MQKAGHARNTALGSSFKVESVPEWVEIAEEVSFQNNVGVTRIRGCGRARPMLPDCLECWVGHAGTVSGRCQK